MSHWNWLTVWFGRTKLAIPNKMCVRHLYIDRQWRLTAYSTLHFCRMKPPSADFVQVVHIKNVIHTVFGLTEHICRAEDSVRNRFTVDCFNEVLSSSFLIKKQLLRTVNISLFAHSTQEFAVVKIVRITISQAFSSAWSVQIFVDKLASIYILVFNCCFNTMKLAYRISSR